MKKFLKKKAIYMISAIAIIFGSLFIFLNNAPKASAQGTVEREAKAVRLDSSKLNSNTQTSTGNWSWSGNQAYFKAAYSTNDWDWPKQSPWFDNERGENNKDRAIMIGINANGTYTFTYNNSTTKYNVKSVKISAQVSSWDGKLEVSGKYGSKNATGGTSFNDRRTITLTMGKTTDNFTISFKSSSTKTLELRIAAIQVFTDVAQYAITLDRQGGTGGSASTNAVKGEAMSNITAPTRTGYTFNGYYDAKTGGKQYYKSDGKSANTWDKTSDTTLYARWSVISKKATLDKNGGTGGTDSVTATYDSDMPEATMPTREGFDFLGYYDATTGGKKYYNADGTSANTWDKTSDTTLYARWVKPLVGEGTKENPYQLGTKAELERFRDIVDGLNDETKNAEACAVLTADIDLEGSETNKWIPIGINTSKDSGVGFGGTFDGKNHKIYNLYVDNTTYKAVGFFGNVNSDNGTAVVKNLTIASGTVKGANQVGGVIGFLSGNASYLHNYADVYATGKKVGGIIGCSWDSFSFCHNEGNITSTSTADDSMVGGIVGYISVSTVEQCYNVGEIKSNGGQVGGIIGYNNRARVTKTFNYGKVTGKNYSTTGSIFGSYTSNQDFNTDSSNSINNYFLKGTASIGTGSGNYAGMIEQLTLKEFKDKSNFKNWYFNNIWTMGDNYPVFREIGEDKDGNKIIFDKDFLLSLEYGQDSFTKDGITVNIDSGGFDINENPQTGEKTIYIYSYGETDFEFASSVGKILEIKITFSDRSSLNDWALVDNTAIWMSTPADKVYFQQSIKGVEKIEVIVSYSSNEVKNLINEIGTVTYTEASKAKIDAAREAYDLLDDSQKTNVNNYNTLTAAEAKYEELLDAATVAEVNGVKYATLQEAFDAVEENGTIKLTKDLNLMDSHIEVSKSITIDLNGHNLKITYTDNINEASLYIEKQNIVLTVDNSKPETGGVDGYVTFGDISQLSGNTYVLFRNCRTMYDTTELGYAVDGGFYKINPGFEVVDIDDGTYFSLVRLTKVVDLSKLTTDYVVLDGQTLTGKLEKAVKISIEDGATITLDNATIDMGINSNNKWSGLTCLGDANIILKGSNTVYAFADGFAGIFVAENYTLTIDGNGLLYAEGGRSAAAIGGIQKNYLPLAEQEGKDGGSIIINNGGIYAFSNGYGAAIGSAMYNSFEDITINGGVVVAIGGNFASGIGTGDGGRCKNITINGGTVIATAGDCNQDNLSTGSAGIGAAYYGTCGNITINKDVVKVVANSSGDADPIGKSTNHATYGNINIASSLTKITDDANCVAMISADLYINGQAVNDNNNSGTGWSYDKETNTLTLTDFVLENNGDLYYDGSNVISASIAYFGKNTLNIVLNGENIITNTFDEENFSKIAGILSMTNLNISGNGSLNVKVTGTAYSNFAIRCFGEMTVESATIVADAGTSIKQSVGIYANGGLELNSGNITATGVNATRTEDNSSYGIDVAGNVVTVKKQVKNFNANGFVAAINGQLITASNGFGIKNDETQVEIKAGETSIDVSDYKKVQIIGYTSQDVINMINELGNTQYTQDYFDAITEVRGAYETLSDTEKAEVTNYDDLTAAETAYNELVGNAIADVIDKIDAIGEVAYTDASKAKIDAAKDAYNALVEGDDAEITNADTLTAANTAYGTLKNAAIANAIAKIDAIGTVAYTDESKELLDAANDAYNVLVKGDEAAITNADTLTAANTAYGTLKNAAIANAIAKIDAIGTVAYTDASKALIDDARDAYDVILEEDQDEITNVAKLTDAETVYKNVDNTVAKIDAIKTVAYTDASKALIDDAKAAYADLTAAELVIIPADKVNTLNTAFNLYYNVDDVVSLIDLINFEYSEDCKEDIDDARSAYNALGDAEKAIFPAAKLKTLMDDEKAYDAMDSINLIGTVVNTADCKTAIITARTAYNNLTADQKGLVADSFVKTLTDDEAVFAVIDLVNAINYENTPDCLTRIQTARAAYNALTADQKTIFPADVLKTLGNDEAAFAVMQKIDLIGTIENTTASRGKVTTARSAYNALDTDVQKELVLNYQKLLDAEASFEAIDDVEDLIDAIAPLEMTEECGKKIKDARDAFNELTPFEQGLVPNTADLVAKETAYNNAKNAIDKINAIGIVKYPDSEEKINAARSAYNALGDEEKDLVGFKNLSTLAAAEGYFNSLKDNALADAVIEKINAIAPLEISEACKAKIDAARTAYNNLTEDQKALVENYEDLTKAETDYAAAKPVVDLINEIGDLEAGDACGAKINSAKKAYEALEADDQKALVNNYKELTDKEAAKPVVDKIALITKVSPTAECQSLINAARSAYDALTEDQKALVTNKDRLFNAEAAKVVADAIEAIKPVEATNECQNKIDAARKALNDLNNAAKALLTNATDLDDIEAAKDAVDLINAIGDIDDTDACQDKIDAARTKYDALTPEQQALVSNYGDLTDREAAKAAVEKIEAIGDVTLTPESKTLIDAARKAFDDLSDDQEALVPEASVKALTDAEAAYKDLDDAADAKNAKSLINDIGKVTYPGSKNAIDAARAAYDDLSKEAKDLIPADTLKVLTDAEKMYDDVDNAVKAIDAIGTVAYTDASKALIDAARAAYDGLTDAEKALVPSAKLDALEDAEDTYQDLLDHALADAATDLINAIGKVKYPDSKEAIEAARDAYDKLTDTQKDIVGYDNYAKLVQAEGNLAAQKDLYFANKVKNLIKAIAPLEISDACKARIDAARKAYDDEEFTDEQRLLVTNYADLEKAEADYAAAKEVVDLIEQLPETVLTARTKYDALTTDQKALVYNYNKLLLAEATKADTLIDAIGTVAYTAESKALIDAARAEYESLNAEQKAVVKKLDVLEAAEDAYAELKTAAIDDAKTKIGAIGEVAYTAESKALIDAARKAFDAVLDADQASVTNKQTLLDAEAAYAALKVDHEAAEAVDAKINAIGTVAYTAESKALIDAARAAYDDVNLTPKQKALVTKAEILTAAENQYNTLKTNAIANAITKIDAIGEVAYTDACKTKIEAARTAFDAVLEADQAGITNKQKLIDAENLYAVLKANNEKLVAVADKINAIGEVEYTAESKAKIDEARKAYDELGEELQALVNANTLKVLTDAEDTYAAMKADHDAADAVADKIAAIGEVAYTPESKALIDAARAAYNGLTAAQKELVDLDALVVLEDAEDAYDAMKADHNAADAVIAKINAIPAQIKISDAECMAAIDDARAAYNGLTANQQALVTNYQTLLDAEVVVADQKIDAIGEVAYTADSKAKIDAARSAFDALTDAQKAASKSAADLTTAETTYATLKTAVINDTITKIGAIGEVAYTKDCKDKIDAARSAFDAVLAADKDSVTNKQKLIDAENNYNSLKTTAINDAKTKIEAIGEVAYTKDCKDKIDSARRAFDAVLTADAAEVTNKQILIDAENNYNTLKTTAINYAITKIDAIGTVAYTPESKALIDAARKAFDAVLTADQDSVTNKQKLIDAENLYAKLKADKEAADAATAKINAIGEVEYTDASKAKIDAARKAYDDLTDDQKALVNANTLKVLTDAESLYAKLKADHEAADAVVAKINSIGEVAYTPESKAKIDAAYEAYEALTADQKNLVNPDALDMLAVANDEYEELKTNHEAAADATDKINAIGTVTYTPESKANIDAARKAYDDLTSAQKGLVDANTLKVLTDAEAAYAALKADHEAAEAAEAKINAIGTVTYTADSKTKIDAARKAYDALTNAQKALVKDADKQALLDAEATYDKLEADNTAAAAVAEKIKAIGTVTYTPESKAKIDAARAAYNGLTADQKALVKDVNTLTGAEAAYKKLEADNTAAKAVADKIAAIGTVTYTADSKAKIDAARKAYDALTADQKALVKDVNTLTGAEAAYKKLEADNKAAANAQAKIDAIGKVAYNAQTKARIDAARTAYNALTTEQKALVKDTNTLTNAEKTYSDVEEAYAKINSINVVSLSEDSKQEIDDARKAYESLTDEEKALVPNYGKLTSSETQYNKLVEEKKTGTMWTYIVIGAGALALVGIVVYVVLFKKKEEKQQ